MNLTQITSADLKKIGKLLERKEALQTQLAEIDSQLGAYGTSEVIRPAVSKPSPAAPAKKRKISAAGRARIAAAQKARWAKLQKAATIAAPAKAVTATTAIKSAKGKRTRPGHFRDSVIDVLKDAGKLGISVKDIATKLGVNAQRIYAWFNATGKNVKEIKKVAPATYGWNA